MDKHRVNITRFGSTVFEWGKRTYVMGIINMSPDSFSGDGNVAAGTALVQAQRFISEGADILDVGGESTRPGLPGITEKEEIERVIPVIEKLSREISTPISVDTGKLGVAELALAAGASAINDQWGLKTEPGLAKLAAAKRVPLILMSNQRDRGGFDKNTGRDTSSYGDVIQVILNSLRQSIKTAFDAGVPEQNIIVDPGIGFGKTWQQDLETVRRLRELQVMGYPVLIGPSRKSLIKMVLDLPANDRVEGTSAVVAVSITNGADIVRVHDVKQITRVCRMTDAIVRNYQ
jgi:dihydropteroate synthase